MPLRFLVELMELNKEQVFFNQRLVVVFRRMTTKNCIRFISKPFFFSYWSSNFVKGQLS